MEILETLKENKKKTIGIGVGVLTLLGGIALANKLGGEEIDEDEIDFEDRELSDEESAEIQAEYEEATTD